jgi:hypothetical protein
VQTDAQKLKGFGWALFWVALFCVVIFYPALRFVPPGKSIYLLFFIPFALWMLSLMLQHDRLNSRMVANLLVLAALFCFGAGFALGHRGFFPEKGGFMVVVFAVPLIFIGTFEILRLIYRSFRHENPCINVRSGRWLGDRPVDGFLTTYPPEKVISGWDVLFGISQMFVPLVITMVLFIWSLAAGC